MARDGIYNKTCPTCSTLVKIDTTRCVCGHSFGNNAQEGQQLLEDRVVQDEELLEEYLVARLSQAVNELEVIEAGLADDPKNLDKANVLLRVFAQVREMRAELETQSAKVVQARKIARASRLTHGMPVDADEETEIPSPSAEPTNTFRAAQSGKAEDIMKAAGMDTKTCPKCRSALPQRAALCFCGFAFTRQDTGSSIQKHASASPSPSGLAPRKRI